MKTNECDCNNCENYEPKQAEPKYKEAMRLLVPMTHYWREESGIRIRAILQVHDELIFEVEDEWISVVAPLIHDTMVHAVELDVPVKVDCEVGANWKDLKEYTL